MGLSLKLGDLGHQNVESWLKETIKSTIVLCLKKKKICKPNDEKDAMETQAHAMHKATTQTATELTC